MGGSSVFFGDPKISPSGKINKHQPYPSDVATLNWLVSPAKDRVLGATLEGGVMPWMGLRRFVRQVIIRDIIHEMIPHSNPTYNWILDDFSARISTATNQLLSGMILQP